MCKVGMWRFVRICKTYVCSSPGQKSNVILMCYSTELLLRAGAHMHFISVLPLPGAKHCSTSNSVMYSNQFLYICGSPGWDSNLIPSRILSASPSLTYCTAKLSLRAGLIRILLTHGGSQELISQLTRTGMMPTKSFYTHTMWGFSSLLHSVG